MRVTHIVPSLPPFHEGVGSYATALARALSDRAGVDSRFVVGDPDWRGEVNFFKTRTISARRPNELLDNLNQLLEDEASLTLIVHYSNYGYEPRGCPAWLVSGLNRWKKAAPERRIVTFFHELFAMGPVWRSSFWLSPLQRRLAARLARTSDALLTNLEHHAAVLKTWRPGRRIEVLPVFSTVGEPQDVPALPTRPPRLAVFGNPERRMQAYSEFPSLEMACALLKIEEILDIGSPSAGLPDTVGKARVRQLGPLAADEISQLLLTSVAGFLSYPPHLLAKSTAFAAYCAHGLIPICAWSTSENSPSPPRVRAETLEADTSRLELEKVADNARQWYTEHSLARQVDVIISILEAA